MFAEITTLDEFRKLVELEPAVLAYFSTGECQVCQVLKPKVEEMMAGCFPKIRTIYVDSGAAPEVAAQNRIFAAPTILVFFEGKEYLRKSRSFAIDELKNEINRAYSLLFS